MHQKTLPGTLIVSLLLALTITTHAQSTADQSFKNIPQQAKQNAENKASTKSNDLSNSVVNKADSASTKLFKGFTGLFKKKDHPANKIPKADSASAPPNSSGAPLTDTTQNHPKNNN